MQKNSLKKNTVNKVSKLTTLEKLDRLIERNENKLFLFLCLFCAFYSFALFNARISEGNDDALYIEAGYNYATHFSTYAYLANAPLYPLLLGGITKIFGINIVLFKLFSVVFNFIGFVFLYKAFKNRIPPTILLTTCILVACNSYIQYYASQTYTESFYLALQFLYLYYFFQLLDLKEEAHNLKNKKNVGLWLITGGLLFLLIMARNATVAALPALALFFLLSRRFKSLLYTFGSFLLFKLPYELIHSILWKQKDQYNAQSKILMLKDPYNPALGNDDFSGFISRFFGNAELYLSKRFFQILGFFSDTYTETNWVWVIFVLALMAVGFYWASKSKNDALFFSVIFSSSLIALTFITLQTRWDQPRLIMIHVPIMLITMLYGLYQLFRKSAYFQNVFIAICVIIASSSFISSSSKIPDNIPIVLKNLDGDKYYGYSPDWVNFFKIGEWCSKNLPDSSLVASRKASMSFVYGNGKKFFPVYKVIFTDTATGYSNPDSVLQYFKRNKVTHVILASLRRDPNRADGNIINTLHRIFEPVGQKYPGVLRLVRQEPAEDKSQIEPAYLYEINYPK